MATKAKSKSRGKLTNYYALIGIYSLVGLTTAILGIPASKEGASSSILGAMTFAAIASLILGVISVLLMFIEFFKGRLNLKGLVISFIVIAFIYLFVATGTTLWPFYTQ